MASTYCATLKALRDGRLRSMRSLSPEAAATAMAAAARPEDSSSAKVKVVDGATSPSPVPSLIGTSSPTMTAANRTHMPDRAVVDEADAVEDGERRRGARAPTR